MKLPGFTLGLCLGLIAGNALSAAPPPTQSTFSGFQPAVWHDDTSRFRLSPAVYYLSPHLPEVTSC